VTMNVGVYHEGYLGQESLKQLKRISQRLHG
jgi:hypothetical protein